MFSRPFLSNVPVGFSLDFWSSPSSSDLQNGQLDILTSSTQDAAVTQDDCNLLNRGRQGKICFINPLFLQLDVCKVSEESKSIGLFYELPCLCNSDLMMRYFPAQQTQPTNHSASNKRHRFKRSMRLRLSESSMNLSLEGVSSYSPPPSVEQTDGSERLQKAGTNQPRRVHPGAGVLRRTPAVSPGSAEEEDVMSTSVRLCCVICLNIMKYQFVKNEILPCLLKTSDKVQESQKPGESGIEAVVLALERRPAPSLAELDSSSSFSSMDEDHDSDSDPESMVPNQVHGHQRPPLVRSRGRGGLHRMSEAFVCFFAPDKRLTRLMEELSRDRRSIFGGMVQDFLRTERETLKSLASASSSSSSPQVTSVQLLQSLRLFLSQAKCCLLDSGELEPPIETLVPENEKGKNKTKKV